jgi:hypothetical protein
MGVVEVKLATSSKASLGERIGQRLLDTERVFIVVYWR